MSESESLNVVLILIPLISAIVVIATLVYIILLHRSSINAENDKLTHVIDNYMKNGK